MGRPPQSQDIEHQSPFGERPGVDRIQSYDLSVQRSLRRIPQSVRDGNPSKIGGDSDGLTLTEVAKSAEVLSGSTLVANRGRLS
jgi:hypothetical protein